MRFSSNGYYVEKYIKCDNCGLLIYGEGITDTVADKEGLFCSQWCIEWAGARADGIDEPKIPLPSGGIHKTH
jgi:5-oxoprolinase (ATP-hydrolysing)/N-methylhydantoinase B